MKKGTGPERPVVPESPAPESPGGRPVPEQAAKQGIIPGMGGGPAQSEPGDVVVDFEKINELMAEKRAAARDAVEHEETPAPEAGAPADGPSGPEPPDKVAVPEEHKSGIDMSRDLLRRSHVLVVCGHTVTEAMKNASSWALPPPPWRAS